MNRAAWGRIIALLPFLGQPLILRPLSRLAGMAEEVLVTSNHPESYRFLGLTPIPDLLPGHGALGGFHASLGDEGMAVLTEPTEKKQAHLRNLGDYLQRGKIFPARQLMTMADYPSGPNWPVFYAESVSLVDFLVARGGPTTFIEFMQRSLRNGYEPELKRTYSLNGFDELDRAWTAHRVQQIAAA